MKLFKNLLATFLILMIAIITFFTWNLISTVIGNYQALAKVHFSIIPLVIFMIEIHVILFAIFNYVILKRRDAFFFKKYTLILACFALVGIVSSILCGALIYHTFLGDFIFQAYPLFMLIIHTILLGFSAYFAFISIRDIHQEKLEKTWKNPKIYWIREVLMALVLMYALKHLGGFLLLPLYWSSYDSIYVLPFYIQTLVPTFLFVSYLVSRYYVRDKKVNIILFSIGLIYSIFSLIYMLVLANIFKDNFQLIVNPLSVILPIERLITLPLGFIVMYLFSIVFSLAYLVINIIRYIKDKKSIQKVTA